MFRGLIRLEDRIVFDASPLPVADAADGGDGADIPVPVGVPDHADGGAAEAPESDGQTEESELPDIIDIELPEPGFPDEQGSSGHSVHEVDDIPDEETPETAPPDQGNNKSEPALDRGDTSSYDPSYTDGDQDALYIYRPADSDYGADLRHLEWDYDPYPDRDGGDTDDAQSEAEALLEQFASLESGLSDLLGPGVGELGESFRLLVDGVSRLSGMLTHLDSLAADPALAHWVAKMGRMDETLLRDGSGNVAMLVDAIRNYRALPSDQLDSAAVDGVRELGAAIDDLNQRLRVAVAGVNRMSRILAEMRDNDGTPTAAMILEIRGHMAEVASALQREYDRRDSHYYDLETASIE